MTPIDIQVSRSKVRVKGQAYSLYVGDGGALVFYKHLYFYFVIIDPHSSKLEKALANEIKHDILQVIILFLMKAGWENMAAISSCLSLSMSLLTSPPYILTEMYY